MPFMLVRKVATEDFEVQQNGRLCFDTPRLSNPLCKTVAGKGAGFMGCPKPMAFGLANGSSLMAFFTLNPLKDICKCRLDWGTNCKDLPFFRRQIRGFLALFLVNPCPCYLHFCGNFLLRIAREITSRNRLQDFVSEVFSSKHRALKPLLLGVGSS